MMQTRRLWNGVLILGLAAASMRCDSGPTTPVGGQVAEVDVSAPASLEVGGSQQLQATPRDGAGNPVSGQPVFWSSSDTSVVRVTSTGIASGVSVGSARIGASAAGRDAFVTLAVVPRAVAAVAVVPAAVELKAGETRELQATASDARGAPLSGRSVAWTSSDTSVATVDASGTVTAHTPGSATITATVEGKSGTAPVTVLAGTPAKAGSASGSTPPGTAGSPLPDSLAVQILDSEGNGVPGVSVTWTVTAGGGSISPATSLTGANGIAKAQWVLGKQAGTQTAAATAAGLPPVVFTVTAQPASPAPPAPVANVSVVPASGTIIVGANLDLNATARDASGNVLTGRPVSWKSSNTTIASVDGTGTVSGRTPGTVVITATVEGKTGTADVRVNAPPAPVVASVTVNPGSATLTSLGATRQFTATAKDAAGKAITGLSVSWSSSKTDVAQVTSAGLATAVGNGTTSIVARVGTVSGTATLTVDQKVDRVVVSPSSATLTAGDTQDFNAEAFDANGRRVAGADVRWSSTNTGVATVNNTSGLVTAKQAGSASIVAAVGGKTATAGLTVVAAPPVPAARVVVSPPSAQLTVGQTRDFDARVEDAAGNSLDRPVVWTSSNPSVATVDAGTGRATGVGAGDATITATSEGKSGTATVNVQPVPVDRVDVAPAAAEIDVGAQVQLSATPRDAAGNALDRPVSWTSSDPSVASVDGNGTVQGLSAGSATISATSEGATGTASATVRQPAAANLFLSRASDQTVQGKKDDVFTVRVRVQAGDAAGPGLAGVEVRWDASDGGSVSPASTTTDADGYAETQWTLGGAKNQTLTATTPDGQRVEFSAEKGD